LLACLPDGQRETFILDVIASRPDTEGIPLALCSQHRWSVELTRAVLGHLRRYYLSLNTIQSEEWRTRRTLWETGFYMHPSQFSEAVKTLAGKAEPGSGWEQIVQSLFDLLEFRYEMYKEIENP
jgi:hypothetical protein